jgi:hypothetical protein
LSRESGSWQLELSESPPCRIAVSSKTPSGLENPDGFRLLISDFQLPSQIPPKKLFSALSNYYPHLCTLLKEAVNHLQVYTSPANRFLVNSRLFQNLTQDYPKSHGCFPAACTLTIIYDIRKFEHYSAYNPGAQTKGLQ